MKRLLALGLFLLTSSLTPLFAGEVFVPFASNRVIGGTTYRTKIWVTNTGAAPLICPAFVVMGRD